MMIAKWGIRAGTALAALAMTAMAAPAWAQELSASELVARNLAARGGAEALAAIKTLRFKGSLRFPGDFMLSYVETRGRKGPGGEDAVRVDATLQGLTVVQAYDGKSGWTINPFQGRRDPETMSADEARALADSGRIDGVLLAARTTGATVTALGREDFDGTDAYKLKVTEKDGDSFVYLLDPGTFLEIAVTETRRIRGAETVTEAEFGDYEKVAGVYFPMALENGPKGASQRSRITIDTAEANVDVPTEFFAAPAAPAAPKPAAK